MIRRLQEIESRPRVVRATAVCIAIVVAVVIVMVLAGSAG
jgi:hypothetical protein